MKNKRIIMAFSTLIFLTTAVSAQTGGSFLITQSVVAAGGGQNSSGGTFSLDGTTGQSVAGNALTGVPFAVTSGFWNFTPFAPTAAQVIISGRVRTADGRGIRNVLVSLTAPDGTTRTVQTSTFGYYRFNNIPVGATYIVSVSAKKFTFSQPTVVLSVSEEIGELDFVADSF